MHIAEGVLSNGVLVAGAAVAAGGVALGLRKMDEERVPTVAVLSSAFFVASLIHVPIAGSSAHLCLTGLMGVVLGMAAFPAILVGALLQAIVFGFGGLTALGANTANMALPAVLCHWLYSRRIRRSQPVGQFWLGAAAGATAMLLSGLLVWVCLYASGEEFLKPAHLLLLAHVPLMFVEGLVTGSAVVFLCRVRPEVLGAPDLAGGGDE